ncbi:MAG: hypothetical protein ACE5JF_11390 [Anaerolineales bacterium]
MAQVEAAFWVGLGLLSPALVRPAWPRAVSLLGLSESAQDLVRRLGPWLWGIAPAYLALISGAVPARFFGLTGHSPLAWFGGAIFCGALIGLVRRPQGDWPTPTLSVLDEPRWALYRASGMLWIPHPELGLLIGLAMALAEWAICFQPWKGPLKKTLHTWRAAEVDARWPAGTWETMARLAGSSLIFATTRNFWLTALSQMVLLGMLRRK